MSAALTSSSPAVHHAETVRLAVAEALNLDPATVGPDSNLMDDLGADSLAFLDIVFRIEQAFSIEITRGEMERAARGDMSAEEFAPAGVISERGLERLRELLPEGGAKIAPGLRATQILSLFTVATFVKIAEGKLTGGAQA
ncbi:MAG: acyl carrier protein [Myxococcales bacterium]|nr:acyl carrier protein [Myxococcales bacterium]